MSSYLHQNDGDRECISPSEVIRNESNCECPNKHSSHVECIVKGTPEISVACEAQVRDQWWEDNAIKIFFSFIKSIYIIDFPCSVIPYYALFYQMIQTK
jgi:hypothetical protein